MSCGTCKQTKCCCKPKKVCGTGDGTGVSANDIAQIQAALDDLLNKTKWLNGHPILALDEDSDIAQFDFSTGLGFNNWIGWGICNGNSYPSPTGNIDTEDLRDRFLTGAYGTYNLKDTGGENFHTLTVAEMPVHNHTLTDPGHTHVVTDPGHTHIIVDPGHTHSALAADHQHFFVTDLAGAHVHAYVTHKTTDLSAVVVPPGVPGPVAFAKVSGPGSTTVADSDTEIAITAGGTPLEHTHDGTTETASVVVNVSSAFTGISITANTTGITNVDNTTGITLADTGSGDVHENRPPYYAVLWIKKIF